MRVIRVDGENFVELDSVGAYAESLEGMYRPLESGSRQWVPVTLAMDAVREAAINAARSNQTSDARRAYELLERLELAAAKCSGSIAGFAHENRRPCPSI